MRRYTTVCVLALIAVALLQCIAALKPMMTPAKEVLLLQEGDALRITCLGRGRVKFSTQRTTARVNQSKHHIRNSFFHTLHTFTCPIVLKEDSGWYACAKASIEIQNDEQTIDHPDTDINWIYVYVNSSEPFAIDAFEDVILPTDIPAVRGSSGSLVIPCRPTSPDLPVILEIDGGKLPVPDNTTYDPRVGFIVSHVTPELRRKVLKCKINETHQTYMGHWPSYIFDPVTITGGNVVRVDSGQSVNLSCDIEGNSVSDLITSWMKIDKWNNIRYLNRTSTLPLTKTHVTISLSLSSVSRSDNGTYHCIVEYKNRRIYDQTYLIVTGAPAVTIDIIKPVGLDSVYLSWTVDDGNDPVKMYSVQQRRKNVEKWTDISGKISSENSSCLVEKLGRNSTYRFAVIATNSIGHSQLAESPEVTTLNYDLSYSTNIHVHDIFDTSIVVGLIINPKEYSQFVHYYEIAVAHGDRVTYTYVDVAPRTHVLDDLETGELYSIEAAACNKYTGRCGGRTVEKIVAIDDAKTILNVTVEETSLHSIKVSWSKPRPKLRNLIGGYKVIVFNLNDVSSCSTSPGNESCIFSALKPGVTYQIEVSACYSYTLSRAYCTERRNTARKSITISKGKEQGRVTPSAVAWIVVAASAILLLFIMAVWMVIWKRREKAARRRFIEAAIEVFRIGERGGVDPELAMADQAELLPYNKKWDFPRKLLTFDKVLGSGAFGIVRKAEAESICKGQKFTTVAVKMVRATHRLNHMTALIRELKILAHLGKHVNIVNLLGACTNRISYGELLVIVEFCRFGNLHDYLLRRRADFVDQVNVATGNIAGTSFRTGRLNAIASGMNTGDSNDDPPTNESRQGTDSNDTSVTVEDSVFDDDALEPLQIFRYEGDFPESDSNPIGTRDLLCWAWQVSRGMKYLSSKQVVHGDLATRNILLADNNVVKICDFGLAKSLYASDIYKKEGAGPLPVKWMAIEAIGDRVFSVKSDVWSFGVVLWEFFTLAKTPYPGIANESIYTKLVDGFRMEKPRYATGQIYHVMLSCWDAEPSNRPPFHELEDTLDSLLEDRFKEHYLDFDAQYTQLNAEAAAEGDTDFLTMSPSEYASSTVETAV